jgi:membrane protein DedA with SNARE-associated domain
MAGALGMPFWWFMTANVPSAFIWGFGVGTIGYVGVPVIIDFGNRIGIGWLIEKLLHFIM